MPKEKVREIDAIMEDMTLTEEEWRQEMTESYKSQYMQMPDIRRMEKEIKEIRENIAAAVQGEKPDPQLLKDLAEALEKADKKMAQAEKEIDEKVEGLVNDDREKRTEFAPESKKKEAPEKEEKEPEKEPEKEEKAPEKEEKKEAPKKEAPEKSLEELKKENEDTMEALRSNADMPQEEWNNKMRKAIEEGCLLENHDLFEEQNKKTKDLTERIDKMRKNLKEGDDKKPLEDLEKEMGDHLTQVTKDRSRVAAQVEDRYADEVYKRRENQLKPKQNALKKEGKAETKEAKQLEEDIELTHKHEKKANDDAAVYHAEAADPKPNIFQSAFMKVFSGWLPQTAFSLVGELFGRPGLTAVQVPMPNYGLPPFFGAGDVTFPTGPDRVKDLFMPSVPKKEKDSVVLEGGADTTGLFKETELKKEKASEIILRADKNADLDFDGIDHEAQKQAEKAGRMSYKPVRGKLKKEDIEELPHAEIEGKQPEVKEEQKTEKKPEKEAGKEQNSARKSFSLKEGSKLSGKALKGVAHAELNEAALQKQEKQSAEIAEEARPAKGEPAKEEPAKEEQAKEEAAKPKKPKFEMGSNIEKAFKLMDLMDTMLGHTGKGHKNSDKYDTMMSALGNVKGSLSEELGGSFGSLKRDFGEMAVFKDLMRPGGPMDLAMGQRLAEVEKKTENYIREKTLNGNKRNMGSGLGNTRIKDALDAMDILNPERAKELGANIDITVKQGKATRKMSYNELNARLSELEKEGDEKAATREKTRQNADKKRKEREMLDKEPLMSKEEKSKQHGMRIK